MSPEQQQLEGNERWSIGRSILERIRSEVNGEDGHFRGEEGESVFVSLYLTERYGCIPDHLLGEDILIDIRNLYYWVLDGVRDELKERAGADQSLWIVVDPSYEDSPYAVLMTDENVLLRIITKAWHFYWENEEEMAQELEAWYGRAGHNLGLVKAAWSDEAREHGQEFVVTLRVERTLNVRAPGPERAAELAMAWQDNENDSDVQLSYEEVLDGTVHKAGENDGEVSEDRAAGREGDD